MCLVKWNHGCSGYIILCSSWAPISNKPQNFGILRICRIPKNIPHLCTSIATPLVLLEKMFNLAWSGRNLLFAMLVYWSVPSSSGRTTLAIWRGRFFSMERWDFSCFMTWSCSYAMHSGWNSIVMENLQTWNSGNRENNVNSLASLCKLYTFWWANHVFSGHALQSGMDLFQ